MPNMNRGKGKKREDDRPRQTNLPHNTKKEKTGQKTRHNFFVLSSLIFAVALWKASLDVKSASSSVFGSVSFLP